MKPDTAAARTLTSYIYSNSPFLVFFWVAIAMPVCIAPWKAGFFSKVGMIYGLAESLFPATVLFALCYLPLLMRRPRVGCIVSTSLSVSLSLLLWVVCFAELFVGIALWCRVNDAVLSLVLQSDSGESAEFITYALALPATHKAFMLSLSPLIAAILMLLLRKPVAKFLERFRPSTLVKAAAGVLLASLVLLCVGLRPLIFGTEIKKQSFMLTPAQLAYASRSLTDADDIRSRIARANSAAAPALGGESHPLIIAIFGESDNKSHSGLYGYRLDTTPKLCALVAENDSADAGRMIVLTDAVTGDATTKYVMQRLFSTNNPEREWADRPLLPAVLRKAGYRVAYFDNQSTLETCENVDYSSVFFLNSDSIMEQSFDARNSERFVYDGDFIYRYMPEALAIDAPAVVFLHLMGQHIRANERYPEDRAVFGADDYAGIDSLSAKERSDVMHYDNATAYLDANLAAIIEAVKDRDAIVVYLSDHSEEIYDYRHQYGRTQEPLTPLMARTLYQVPAFVYFTPAAARRCPGLADTLSARADAPFFTYNFPDLLLDMAGVSGAMTDGRRSLASPAFDATQPRRILHGTCDYDSLMRASGLR
ncbi:MAG: phosphoethanolamine transferase [Muribaculaceae bacterium]|nr:phosphoethanolamine transferase [Muribaculaceae bacterium]